MGKIVQINFGERGKQVDGLKASWPGHRKPRSRINIPFLPIFGSQLLIAALDGFKNTAQRFMRHDFPSRGRITPRTFWSGMGLPPHLQARLLEKYVREKKVFDWE